MRKTLLIIFYLNLFVTVSFGQKIPQSPNEIKINDATAIDSLSYIESIKVNSKKLNAVFIGIESDDNDLIQRIRELVYILRKSSYRKIGIVKRKANGENSFLIFAVNGMKFGPIKIDKEVSKSYVEITGLNYFLIDKIIEEYEKQINTNNDTVYIKQQSDKVQKKYKDFSRKRLVEKRENLIKLNEKQIKERNDALRISIAHRAYYNKLQNKQEYIKILNKYGLNNNLNNTIEIDFNKISELDMKELNRLYNNEKL